MLVWELPYRNAGSGTSNLVAICTKCKHYESLGSMLRDAIRLTLGHLRVIIESDSQEAVRMLNEAKFSRADLASLSVSTEKQMCTRAPIFNLATLSIPTEKQMKRHTGVPNRLVRVVEDVSG